LILFLIFFSIAFCEDKPVARSNIVSKNNGPKKDSYGGNWNKGYNNEHSENKEHHNNNDDHENKQHSDDKHGDDHEEHDDDRVSGPQFFRMCFYGTSSCTFAGAPSCLLVENGQCIILTDGQSNLVYAIGDSVTLLHFSDPACSNLVVNYPPTQFGTCFGPTKSGLLYIKMLSLADLDDA